MLQIQQINFPFILIVGTITFFVFILAFFLFVKQYQRRKYMHIQEKQFLQSQFSQTLLQSQLEIQEQTLKNISQEIHDNVGQVLSLAKLNLATSQSLHDEKVTASQQLVSKAIQDLRDLSRSLDTDYVAQMGLLRSVEYELEMIQKTGTLQTKLNVEGSLYKFDKQKELILFRIVQEILHNIIKHAGASAVSVQFMYTDDALKLTVIDDGKGFDLSPLNDDNNSAFGLGIRNMHNRAKLMGAEFSMHSKKGEGTTATLLLHKENNANHEH
jgi:two-component system, NarL family, sensor kinase